MSRPGPPHPERRVPEKVAHLRLLERAATVATQAVTPEEAAAVIIDEVSAYTGWAGGRFVLATETGLSALAARVMATGAAVWSAEGRGFPVRVGDTVVGVLEFEGGQAEPADDAVEALVVGAGHHLGWVVERARTQAALRHAEERYRAVVESARDVIVTAEADGTILSMNQAAERTFGYREDEVLAQPLTALVPGYPVDRPAELAGRTIELTGVRRDGRAFPVDLSISSWESGGARFYAGVIRDITDRRQAEQDRQAIERQLLERTLHDSLTGLPNRALLRDRLGHALALAGRRGSGVLVLALDLDRFKAINDGFGRDAGDELLVAVARRLEQTLRSDDTVARIGDDEFALLCEDLSQPSEAWAFAERVTGAFARTFELSGREVAMSASVGAALAAEGARPDDVLRNAEVAMEQARLRGRGQAAVYDDTMRADEHARLAVEQDLRVALVDDQLRLYYQPIVDIGSGAMVGVEALVRWEHPSRGLLMPLQFIAQAEESGLIVPLGQWVLEEACHQGAAWHRHRRGYEHLRVSVNVSARQFERPQWADDVANALLLTGFPAEHLVLEITESVLMQDVDTTAKRLEELRSLGVRIAIDDFGTGYSSLGYLRRFPVDILKVDKSFVDGIADGPHESALARAVIKLAASLQLEAVAEGVSSRKQLATLRRLRCRYGQGYLFARPQPADVLDGMIGGKAVANW